MNFEANWDISFKTQYGVWNLGIIAECNIDKSSKNLADRATIILPEMQMNKVIKIQEEIKRGDEVQIRLGYDKIYETEFIGFVREIITNESAVKIECEDALFVFRNSIKDKQFKPTSVKQLAQYVINQINPSYKLDCDYDIGYEKYTIHQAHGFDVLAKIQEETGADIYFDMESKTLHIHPAYTRKAGEVDYSPQQNIENFSLDYKTTTDKKVEVTVESIGLDGKVKSYTTGKAGGEKITKKVGRLSKESIKILAHTEYKNRMTDGYEGSFDAWAIPYVEPSFTAGIYDEDYPERDGRYYVDAVTTNFSPNGIVRTVQLGIKLSE